MAAQTEQPTKMTRAKSWSDEVEEAYRFQLAGYRDEKEYVQMTKCPQVSVLQRREGICTDDKVSSGKCVTETRRNMYR